MIAELTDRAVLEAWSRSRDQPAGARADVLLTCAPAADGDAGDPLGWTLARRHAALAALHASRWGSRVEAVTACPACATEVCVEFDLGAVPAPADAGGERSASPGVPGFRLPTRADVRASAHAADPRRALVECCLIGPAGELAAPELEAIAAAMEAADPLGALELELTCPDCEHDWEEPLYLDEFLAAEAQHDARTIAAEIHELALAYGWTESEILALPAPRRRLYLELVCT
jgi:hypothetical protein